MLSRLASLAWRRHAPAWIMATLTLAGHLALGLAVGAGGTKADGEAAGHEAAPAVMTVQLRASAVAAGDTAAAPQEAVTAAAPANIAEAAPAAAENPAALLPVVSIAEHYYAPGELSESPTLIHDVTADISFLDLPAGAVQSARLRLLINESGDIDQVEVLRSQLPADVVKAVIAAYSHLKFRPGKIGELSVKSALTIEVRLENALPAA